jgi:hypothetical protein
VRQTCATALVFAAIFGAWTIAAHGGPLRWLRYMAFIAARENTDVALLLTRAWAFEAWRAITPIAALVGLGVALAEYRQARARGEDWTLQAYGIAVAWIALVLGITVFNGTFFFEIYWALPLLVAVLAIIRSTPRTRRLFAALLLAFAAARTVKYVRVGATWAARDPAPLDAFVRANVPAGADVVGPEDFYFFAVERAGAHYLFAYPDSWATWARWVPQFDPSLVHACRRCGPNANRFLIWPSPYYSIPPQYACAIQSRVATYDPPALPNLGPLSPEANALSEYPTTVVYRLRPSCGADTP